MYKAELFNSFYSQHLPEAYFLSQEEGASPCMPRAPGRPWAMPLRVYSAAPAGDLSTWLMSAFKKYR